MFSNFGIPVLLVLLAFLQLSWATNSSEYSATRVSFAVDGKSAFQTACSDALIAIHNHSPAEELIVQILHKNFLKAIVQAGRNTFTSIVDSATKRWLAAERYDQKVRLYNYKPVFAANRYPDTALIQRHLELARAARAKFGTANARELETYIAQELTKRFRETAVTQIKEEFMKLNQTLQANPNANFAQLAKETEVRLIPILQEFFDSLKGEFPLSRAVNENQPVAREALALAETFREAHIPLVLMNERGQPELRLSDPAARVYFEPALSTLVLEHPNGFNTDQNGPILALNHGAGGLTSHAASWWSHLPKFVSSGYSPQAIDLPGAGLGVPLGEPALVAAYLKHRYQWLSSISNRPIISLSLSMGGLQEFAHALYQKISGGSAPVVAGRILWAFANPFSFDRQMERAQARSQSNPEIQIDIANLDKSKVFASIIRTELQHLLSDDPNIFRTFGDDMLFQIGRRDQDLGPEGIKETIEFRDRYVPLGHVYVVEPAPFDGIDSSQPLSADHFLYSNHPFLQNQYFEMMVLNYSFMDYLEESPHTSNVIKDNLRLQREQIIRSQKLNPNARYVDWYLRRENVDLSSARAPDGRLSIVRKVQEFWEQERIRVAKIQ